MPEAGFLWSERENDQEGEAVETEQPGEGAVAGG